MLKLQSPLLNSDPYGEWCAFLVRSWRLDHCHSSRSSMFWKKYFQKSTHCIERFYATSGAFTSYPTDYCWESGCCNSANTYYRPTPTYAIHCGGVLTPRWVSDNWWVYDGWKVDFSDNNKFRWFYLINDSINGFLNTRRHKMNEHISLVEYFNYLSPGSNYDTLYNNLFDFNQMRSVGEYYDGERLTKTWGFGIDRYRTIVIIPNRKK